MRLMRLAPVLLGVGLAGLVGWDVHSRSVPRPPETFTFSVSTEPRTFPCTVASVEEAAHVTCAERGDNGRPIRLRLAGLDAPQLGETCAAGQPCASLPAARATAALTALALGQRLTCEADRPYSRSITFCTRADGVDLSCAMLAGGYAARSDRGWGAHDCPT